MNSTKETITPKKALAWLKENNNNRPMSARVSSRYAAQMKDGQWKLNGETIKFDTKGRLVDGQHRLSACVEAGVSFESYVIRDLPPESFDTIDQGSKRTAGDVFARRGEKHYVTLASTCNLLTAYRMYGTLSVQGGQRLDHLVKTLQDNPKIRDCIQDACDIGKKGKLLSPSVIGFLLFIFSEKDATKAKEFMTRVLQGEGLAKGMPEYRLRERLIDNSASIAKLRAYTLCALAIKAWNLSRQKKPCGVLGFKDNEEFPKPI